MTPTEAYDALHLARQALGPPRPVPADFGETAVEAIRKAVEQIQTVLILRMDGISPAELMRPHPQGIEVVQVAFDREVYADLVKFHREESGDAHMHETVYRIVRAWLRERRGV